MKIVKQLRPAIVVTLLLTVLTGIVYPFLVTGLAQVIFPNQANGSLVKDSKGNIIGSSLIGQYWTAPQYFHGRPSATLKIDGSGPEPYNGQNSSASNLGPTNSTLLKSIEERTKELQRENPGVVVPVDLVTASGSGLDPDISVAGALFQIKRVAKERGLSEGYVKSLVMAHVQGRFLGIFGEERINVLDLNLALDKLK